MVFNIENEMAVKQNGIAIQYIGQEYRTLEIIMEIMKQNGKAIQIY